MEIHKGQIVDALLSSGKHKRSALFVLVPSILLMFLLCLDLMQSPDHQLSVTVLVYSIEEYQMLISPLFKGRVRCKFRPPCSSYAVLALEKYGTVRGTVLTIGRLWRCSPLSEDQGQDYP